MEQHQHTKEQVKLIITKAELPRPVYACVFHIALHFGMTIDGFQTFMNQCWDFQNAMQFRKRICKEDVATRLKAHYTLISFLCRNVNVQLVRRLERSLLIWVGLGHP